MDSRKVIRIHQLAGSTPAPRQDMWPAAVLCFALAAMLALGWAIGNGCGDVEARQDETHASR